MRIAVMGSGGVGGFFGGRLAKGGADVHLRRARRASRGHARARACAIESAPAAIHLPKVNVTDDPARSAGRPRAVRRQAVGHRGGGARSSCRSSGPRPRVISFQNGVQKDDMLRAIFGEQALSWAASPTSRTTIAGPASSPRPARCSAWCSASTTAAAPARRALARTPASAAASTPSSAPTSAAPIWEKYVFLVGAVGRDRRPCACRSGRSAQIR